MLTDNDQSVSMVCQRCKQPLRMDESFADLAPSAYDMIASLSDRSSSIFYQNLHNSPNLRNQTQDRTRSNVAFQSNFRRPARTPQSSILHHPAHRFNSQPMSQPTSYSTGPSAAQPNQQSGSKVVIPTSSDSFVVLSDSTLGAARAQLTTKGATDSSSVHHPQSSSSSSSSFGLSSTKRQTERLLKLCEILSNNLSGLQHPLCSDCTDILLELMNNQLQAAKSDRDRYAVFERDLNRENILSPDSGSAENCKKLEAEIEKLQIKSTEASEKLQAIEFECEKIDAKLVEIEKEEALLDEEEQTFWENYNKYELDLLDSQSQTDSIVSSYQNDYIELEKLMNTSVYKDAFCIGCEAGVGTINGLRLGKLTEVPVEWVEINAAWGHTVLLLQTLCKRMNFTLDGYRLIPMGSFSKIERSKSDKACLELFGSDDFAFTRVLHNRRFDNAMVEFLECLRQVSEQAVKRGFNSKLPFNIHKDKIGEYSIKLSFSSDEAWTGALRHVLYTLKVINSALDHPPQALNRK
ncbi:autophagy protein Apg6-domain-containing protein [Phakopsora pachyrhizi]|nr:autophagy protein Apg6-domain-containing protein [Phakopsora pachyrhizi]